MDAIYKEKWLEALRSGKYKQTKGRLRRVDNTYCCLGVLCDLLEKDRKIIWKKNYEFYEAQDESNAQTPNSIPYSIRNEIEIDSNQQHQLIVMNDSGESFDTIADYIEKNL